MLTCTHSGTDDPEEAEKWFQISIEKKQNYAFALGGMAIVMLQKGDFTGCPHVTFVYGSDETLYACAPSFEKAMKKYGVNYDMIVGEGMFHCYPVFPIVKEAKEGWDMMVELVRKQGR